MSHETFLQISLHPDLNLGLAGAAWAQTSYSLLSPDQRIEVKIRTGDRFSYDILFKGTVLLQNSTFSIDIDHNTLGLQPKVKSDKGTQLRSDARSAGAPEVRQEFASATTNCASIPKTATTPSPSAPTTKASPTAWKPRLPQAEVKVYGEESIFHFPPITRFFPEEESFLLAQRTLLPAPQDGGDRAQTHGRCPPWWSGTASKSRSPNPTWKTTPASGCAAPAATLGRRLPAVSAEGNSGEGSRLQSHQAADYIAVTKGTRTYPWRLMGIAEKDGDLITNPLVWLLAKPSQVQDTSWIRPGKVAWDWWNANNVYGVNFKSGVNTQTYKYYMDFAAKYGIRIHRPRRRLVQTRQCAGSVTRNQHGRVEAYGKQKNVGIILWVVWKTLDDQSPPASTSSRNGASRASRLISCSATIKADQLLLQDLPRGGQAPHAGRLSWRAEPGHHDPDLAQHDQQRRRARAGMEQVER